MSEIQFSEYAFKMLVSEHDKMRAEIERLKGAEIAWHLAEKENERLRAEIERLRRLHRISIDGRDDIEHGLCAEVDRLRAAMREALEMCDPRETRSHHIGLVLRKALVEEK